MSRRIPNQVDNQQWGPSHQQMTPPWQQRSDHSLIWRVIGWFLAAMFLHTIIDNKGGAGDEITWCLKVMTLGWIAKWVIQGVRDGRIPIGWLTRLGAEIRWWLGRQFVRHAPNRLFMLRASWRLRAPTTAPELEMPLAEQARAEIAYRGGGAYLGTIEDGEEWVTAEAESAVMVLGPPRSGQDERRDDPRDPQRTGAGHQHEHQAGRDAGDERSPRRTGRGLAVRPRRQPRQSCQRA